MTTSRGPSLRAQWLGEELREAREAAGLTLKEAGAYLQRDRPVHGEPVRGGGVPGPDARRAGAARPVRKAVLVYGGADWRAFLAAVRTGRFDRDPVVF